MNNILQLINESEARTIGKVDDDIVNKAQEDLNFEFDNQYKSFVENFGVLSCGSDEIFGLGIEGYMNVVTSTLEERDIYKGDLENYIVIQDYGNGGILITLDSDGVVYEFRNNKNTKIYNSFNEFLEKEIL